MNDLISSISIDSDNFSIVMANQDLLVQVVDGWAMMLNVQVNLSDEFKLTSLGRMDSNFVVFAGRDKDVIIAGNGCAFTWMSFEYKT